jgi:formylglycine-generating enzyme required for sulfatase activity
MEEIKKVIKAPLVDIGKTGVDPESLLRNIRDRSGIFMGYSEKEYGFAHHSFQEYLAAEEIRNLWKTDLLAANYNNKWWKEVILLALALDNSSLLETFLEKILPTQKFEEEPSLVESAMADSIVKPQPPFIKVISDETLSAAIRVNAIRIFAGLKGEDVARTLKEAAKGKPLEVARAAYEKLNIRGEAEGVEEPREEIARLIVHARDNSEMVLIPAGTFLYGSKDDDKQAHSDEKPQRSINLPAFYMDKYPVTNEQYCLFLSDIKPDKKNLAQWINLEGSYENERCRIKKEGEKYLAQKGYERHPVIYVSWHGAKAYADRAEKRLPTEQEWEKASRGSDGRIYPWGDKFDAGLCNSRESGNSGTTEVGRYSDGQSYYGCFDMAGNVWEWTDSLYDKGQEYRALRGGSWFYYATYCRCAYRFFHPGYRSLDVGFRCARTLTL